MSNENLNHRFNTYDYTGANLSPAAREADRKQLEKDIKAFLKKGGTIQQLDKTERAEQTPPAFQSDKIKHLPPGIRWSRARKQFSIKNMAGDKIVAYTNTLPEAIKIRKQLQKAEK